MREHCVECAIPCFDDELPTPLRCHSSAVLDRYLRIAPQPLTNPAGFYSVNERKRNATRTYLVFLILSIFLDVVWLSVYGNYIYSYLRVVEFEYTGQVQPSTAVQR